MLQHGHSGREWALMKDSSSWLRLHFSYTRDERIVLNLIISLIQRTELFLLTSHWHWNSVLMYEGKPIRVKFYWTIWSFLSDWHFQKNNKKKNSPNPTQTKNPPTTPPISPQPKQKNKPKNNPHQTTKHCRLHSQEIHFCPEFRIYCILVLSFRK